jgi:phosphate transport system substrate-binding protein
MMNHWAAEFNALYPEVELDIRGGGANTNVLNAFVEGTIDLVPISRPLPAETITAFKARYGYEPTQITIAPDALGIYVNKNNPIAGLSLAQ